jgi:hypothetical protein
MSQFAAFDASVNELADSLRAHPELRTTILNASTVSQKYTFRELTDIVNLLDSLNARITSPTIQARIADVRAKAVSSFRLRNLARNGGDVGNNENDVLRSTGLNIVLPSGVGEDRFADEGPRSFEAYQALRPQAPWTLLLADLASGTPDVNFVDQGNAPFQGVLLWDPESVVRGVDVDMWVVEPDGNIYIPFLGSVSPNGTFTNDSFDDDTYFEAYTTNRFIAAGDYLFIANLFTDPQDFQPQFDFLHRLGPDAEFESIYAPDFPQLSKDVSWLDDPTPTFDEILAGAYTDLRGAALFTVDNTLFASRARQPVAVAPRLAMARGRSLPRLTTAQMTTLRRLAKERVALPTTGPRRIPDYRGTLPGSRP